MSAAPAPGRARCPVPGCTNDFPSAGPMALQLMCMSCWGRLPQYVRISVDATLNACRRQNTKANQARHHVARTNAISMAQELRP